MDGSTASNSNPNGNSNGAVKYAPSAASRTPYAAIPPIPRELIAPGDIKNERDAELMVTSKTYDTAKTTLELAKKEASAARDTLRQRTLEAETALDMDEEILRAAVIPLIEAVKLVENTRNRLGFAMENCKASRWLMEFSEKSRDLLSQKTSDNILRSIDSVVGDSKHEHQSPLGSPLASPGASPPPSPTHDPLVRGILLSFGLCFKAVCCPLNFVSWCIFLPGLNGY